MGFSGSLGSKLLAQLAAKSPEEHHSAIFVKMYDMSQFVNNLANFVGLPNGLVWVVSMCLLLSIASIDLFHNNFSPSGKQICSWVITTNYRLYGNISRILLLYKTQAGKLALANAGENMAGRV